VILHELLGRFDSEVPLVGVVGDVHLLASYQLEIEAILLAGKHLQLVEQGNAALARYRRVIGELRRQLDATHAGRIAPGPSRFGLRIEVVGKNDQLSGTARGIGVHRPYAGIHRGVAVGLVNLVVRHFLEGHRLGGFGDTAVAVHHPAVGRGRRRIARADLVAQLLVPHGFIAGLRNRKRQAATADRIDSQTIILCGATGSIAHRRIEDFLRIGGGAVTRIDIHVPGIRVFFHQGFLPFAELVGVLLDIARIDAEQGLFVLERIDPEAAIGFVSGRASAQPTLVRWNAAFGIAGLDRAERRQALAQLLGLFGGDGRHTVEGGAHQRAGKGDLFFH